MGLPEYYCRKCGWRIGSWMGGLCYACKNNVPMTVLDAVKRELEEWVKRQENEQKPVDK